MRVLASLAFAVWFYDATGRITQALGTSTRDGALRAIDEAIFGQTSAVFCERFSDCLFTGFAIGFAGYLLVPAVGPARAYDELFTRPLPSGAIGREIMGLMGWGSSGFDVFPSLHVTITCVLLAHDWVEVRRRFWVMVGPVAGLVVSTVYLRYHYGLDVLAGAILFLVLKQTLLKSKNP